MDLWGCQPFATVGAMKGYGQFCPVAIASEIFAERWTPLILRELFAGARRFNDIRRGLPLISRTLLAQRLRALEEAGVVHSRPLQDVRGREYGLTRSGEEFRDVVERLGEWGQRWSTSQFDVDNLDMSLLMWNVRRRMVIDRLPSRRVVVRFDFRGVPRRCSAMRTFWMVLQRPEVDVCLKDPGFDVDVVVAADAATMARVWLGKLTFAEAQRSGGIRLEGARPLTQAFPGWLLLSHFAHVEPRAHAG
jgi:DNA-binding HxlR family transcriptional regulator